MIYVNLIRHECCICSKNAWRTERPARTDTYLTGSKLYFRFLIFRVDVCSLITKLDFRCLIFKSSFRSLTSKLDFTSDIQIGLSLSHSHIGLSIHRLSLTISTIRWLMLFKKMIAVYAGNHTRVINRKCTVTDC